MKRLSYLLPLLIFLFSCASNKSLFELSPAQSMSITGKGPGQDAAINPFSNSDSYAVVKNVGKGDFVIRTQEKGKIIEMMTISSGELKNVELLKGYELYLDSKVEAKARVTFKESL